MDKIDKFMIDFQKLLARFIKNGIKKCLKVRQKLGTRENLKIFENLKNLKF